MRCPNCSFEERKLIYYRTTVEVEKIRRRRECLSCGRRFTTYEAVETLPIIVVKRDKNRQTFDRRKILNGIDRACEKRPIPVEQREQIVDDIEAALQSSLDREVSSVRIGEMVMDRLRSIDEVAYVRFASVYRQFRDVNTFMDELNKLLDDKNK